MPPCLERHLSTKVSREGVFFLCETYTSLSAKKERTILIVRSYLLDITLMNIDTINRAF